jgi:hypothetical protein
MDVWIQEILKVLIAMVFGGAVQAVRGYYKRSVNEKIEDVNLRRDLQHLTRTQAQHSQVLAQLDPRLDKVIAYIQIQNSRIVMLESQMRVQQGLKSS